MKVLPNLINLISTHHYKKNMLLVEIDFVEVSKKKKKKISIPFGIYCSYAMI